MVMGGIPYYLDAVSPDRSAAQNIEELCFREGALLTTEYQNLFASLFKNASKYEAIISSLASKTRGMTRNELISSTGIPTGGSISKRLDELEESGFISRYSPFNRKSKTTLYRLSDFYNFFYHKYIKSHKNAGEGTWLNAIDSPSQRAWAGFAFEQICLAHIPQIKKALGISGVLSHAISWRSKSTKEGAQVDLLIDRRDQVINLFELKYSINPYLIDKAYADKLRKKIAIFKSETKTRKAIFLTFITTFGLVQNAHAASLVQHDILMDALFE